MVGLAVEVEAYGGPADGMVFTLDPDQSHLEYIYIRLPARGKKIVYNTPPKVPYAIYKVGLPKPHKCHWAGDVLYDK